MRLVQSKQNAWALSPSVVETYSRLLVYNEIESLGIKGFFGKSFQVILLPPALSGCELHYIL